MHETADQAEQAIRDAFAKVQRPATLRQKRNSDVDDMDRDLKSKPWATLTGDELMRHRAALGMIDAEAFRFYLPAFLVASLDDKRAGYVEDLREATLYSLAPHLKSPKPDPARAQALRARTELLDEKQRAAVRGYLAVVRAQTAHPKEFSALDPNGFWA